MDIQQINSLIKSQEECYKTINQLFTNIKKDSATRKTEEYIRNRRTQLTEAFTKASENHAKLEDQEALKKHSYVESDYFGTIKGIYTSAIQHLEKCEERIKSTQQLQSLEEIRPETNRNNSAKMNLQLYRIKQMQFSLNKAKLAVSSNKPSSHFKMLIATLQTQCDKIEETHFSIMEEEGTLEHEYFQDQAFETLKLEYDIILDQLYDKIQTGKSGHGSSLKLPEITIPTFSGRYESWSSFYDLFSKVIHEDESLTATEKMQYLKTHIKGEAYKLIKHLTIGEANYSTAWTLLINRYKNERIIITKHVDNIMNLQKIKIGTASNLKNLHDTMNENLEALKNQKIDISSWCPLLTRMLSRTWDSETDEKYEEQLQEPNQPQSFSSMMLFLEKRFKCLENSEDNIKPRPEAGQTASKQRAKNISSTCWLCNDDKHTIYECKQFTALSAHQRNSEVIKHKICKQCLKHESSYPCHSTATCRECGKHNHHTWLHRSQTSDKPNKQTYKYYKSDNYKGSTNTAENPSTSKTKANMSTTVESETQKTTLLATALVQAHAIDGTPYLLRVLCDQGSEASFCTEEVAQLLSYPRSKVKTEIVGIADETPKTSNYCIDVELEPRFPSEFKLPIKLIVLPKLTGSLPNKDVPQVQPSCLVNKLIADPTYYQRGPINIILGAQEYSRILLQGLDKNANGIIAQNTEFGWILSGICCNPITNSLKVVSMTTTKCEIEQVTKFWELEEVPEKYNLSKEDILCETFYHQTTIRNEDGTYTVRIPFKNPNIEYGNTRQIAAARLLQLERKLEKNSVLKNQYKEFLKEYQEMGHMRKVPKSEYCQGKYYIPHQPVIKEDSLTTKLRVVFDASSKVNPSRILRWF